MEAAYQRWVPQQAPKMKPETIALLGGSVALVAVVIFMKNRKKRKRKRA